MTDENKVEEVKEDTKDDVKEEKETEENTTSQEVAETKEVTEASPEDKALLNKGIILTAITIGVGTLHQILGWCYSGNLPWFITNLVFLCGVVPLFLISLLTFTKKGIKTKDTYIPAFVLTLVALILSALLLLAYSIDTLTNLFGFINEVVNK